MSKLSIGTADGATWDLHLEPGPPYFAFWNLLLPEWPVEWKWFRAGFMKLCFQKLNK